MSTVQEAPRQGSPTLSPVHREAARHGSPTLSTVHREAPRHGSALWIIGSDCIGLPRKVHTI
jgi:hypothetical protein